MRDTLAEREPDKPLEGRLDSWKDIAGYLQREVRTVQLWEKNEGLPVHRHAHKKRGTVYAYKSEIDDWSRTRTTLQRETLPSKPRLSKSAIAFIATGALTIGAAAWLTITTKPLSSASESSLIPLTSDPGSETGTSFSPDGNQIAFSYKREGAGNADIYVKTVGRNDGRPLTNTPDWDAAPAWSPDGSRIAFHRSRSDRSCALYTVPVAGGSERLLVELSGPGCRTPGCEIRCGCWSVNPKLPSAQLSWSPDGKWLAHAGITTINVATREQRSLTVPPDGQIDAYPAFSPDGKSVAFVRRRTSSIHDLYVIDAAGGTARRLPTQGNLIFGLSWTPHGGEIVYSSDTWEFGDAALWRVAVDGGPPRRVEQARERAWLPAISAGAPRLAFTRRSNDTNIWQVAISATGDAAVTRLIASTRADAIPALSPDGKRIAFTSERSGTLQVWVSNRDGSDERQLTFFAAPGAGLAAWSPDSKMLAFDSRVRGDHNVYVIDANGGSPRQITPDGSHEAAPNWSLDGKWIYFASTRTGRHEIWKMPVAGGPAVQLTKDGGNRPVASVDGTFVYYDKGPFSGREFEVWQVPVDGGQEVPLFQHTRARSTVVGTGVYYYDRDATTEVWMLKFFDFATRSKRLVANLPGMPVIGGRPAVSPDGRSILYTQFDLSETDLMLVENFR